MIPGNQLLDRDQSSSLSVGKPPALGGALSAVGANLAVGFSFHSVCLKTIVGQSKPTRSGRKDGSIGANHPSGIGINKKYGAQIGCNAIALLSPTASAIFGCE